MEREESGDSDLYRDYRAEVEGEPLQRALRRAAFVLMVINTAFILVDWIVYPGKLLAFLPVRIGLDLFLAVVLLWLNRAHPVMASLATSFAGGAMLFVVVLGTGGASSDYYVGLVLLVIGIGVLAPLSLRQGAFAIGTLFSIYALLPLISGGTIVNQSSALNLFFLGAAAFVGIMSCGYLDRMRFSDFKQRKELHQASEELKELDREKSRFTANVHHELRTPLTLMLAPIDMFLGGEFGNPSSEQRRYLESMQSNGRRLLKLINNLLDLAKIEGNQLEIHRSETDIGSLISEIVSGARPYADQKLVKMAVRGFEDLPPVFIDRDAIEKVVVNLLGNALKFSGEDGLVTVSGRAIDSASIEISVSDTGVGLEADQLERIFDRFAQADSSNTRRFEGTGIGLSLARELVALHGGEVWAESDGLGMGTTFTFVLPVGEPDEDSSSESIHIGEVLCADDAPASTERVEAKNRRTGGGNEQLRFVELERNAEKSQAISRAASAQILESRHEEGAPSVLVVDDNHDMRQLLADILGHHYRVRTAINGRVGFEVAAQTIPDLILTDVMMPEMSGTELCRKVKADEKLRNIPVVLVTSKAEREMKIRGLELGADDYITKPFHPRELLARVGSLVRVTRLQRDLSIQYARLESTNVELAETLNELREASARLIATERLAAVGELAAGVAHEVNNPVNFAMNALRTLNRSVVEVQEVGAAICNLDFSDEPGIHAAALKLQQDMEKLGFSDVVESLGELVQIVEEGLERTHRLVDDLKEFATPGQESMSEVDVARGVESTTHLLAHSMRELGISLEVRIDEGLPRLEGNARALNQVFLNLLKNAAEAIPDQGGEIRISVGLEDSDICVRISDNGPGIDERDLPRLFEPFFSKKAAGEGTGLGLSISKRIVSEFGGAISVTSTPGEGSEFLIRLPVKPVGGEKGVAAET